MIYPAIHRPLRAGLLSVFAVLAIALPAGLAGAADAGPAPFTFACGFRETCPPQAGPGPADRQVRPFEGSLGRPCAYRWRETPSGTRKVRVCF